MKITTGNVEHETTRTTDCTFELDDVAPIPVSTYGARDLQPRRAEVRVQDGVVHACRVYGPAITKAGLGAERYRTFYSYEDPLVAELVRLALDAYRAEHGEVDA